jgi:hypothetical protein
VSDDLTQKIFEAVLPIVMAEATSERRNLNPWFSMQARGEPPKEVGHE